MSSAYPVAPTGAVPAPAPAMNSTAGAAAPSYPAGNATAVAPTGSGAPTTVLTSTGGSSPTGGYGSGSGSGAETSAGAVGGSSTESAGASSQTGNVAGVVSVETGVLGAVFAGLLALLA